MSYLFDHATRGTSSQATTTIAGSAQVGDKPDDTGKSKEIGVLIFTAPDDRFHVKKAEALSKICSEGDITSQNLAVSLSDYSSTIERFRRSGELGDNTQIVVEMHGAMKSPPGQESGGETHFVSGEISTLDFIKTIRQPLEEGEKPCSATIYISACRAGDNRLRDEVQKLQNQYGVGVCFLLASSKAVLSDSTDAALSAMCEQFVAAKRADAPPPDPHHIFARIAMHRGDCVTMIQANGMVITHAPKSEKEFGLQGLMEATASALIIPDSGRFALPAREEAWDEARGANVKKPHVTVAGDAASLEHLSKTLAELKDQEDKKWAESQWLRVIPKRGESCYKEELEKILETKTDFMASISKEEWNSDDMEMADFLRFALEDDNPERRNDKAEYLFEFLNQKKNHFDAQDDETRQGRVDRMLESPLFEFLMKKDFLIKSEREGLSEEDRIRHLGMALAKKASPEDMSVFLENPTLQKNVQEKQWNASHQLIADMLARAVKDRELSRGNRKVQILRALLESNTELLTESKQEALKAAATSSMDEMQSLVSRIPSPDDDMKQITADMYYDYTPSKNFIFLEDMLAAVKEDQNPDRRQQKITHLIDALKPQLGLWAARAEAEDMESTLRSIPGFPEEFASDTWNDAHLLVLQMIRYASMDSEMTRSDAKIDALFKMLSTKQAAFDASPARDHLIQIIRENNFTSELLEERGFLKKADQ